MRIQISIVALYLAVAAAIQCSTADAQYAESAPAGEDSYRRVQNVNVPIFYDMIRSGSSLGINVLQGLVRVEKGAEAERNGLVGPRPLSVRIFGIPVYERGVRMRPADSGPRPGGSLEPSGPRPGGEEEELPIEPSANLVNKKLN